MSQAANLTSVAAVAELKAALAEFDEDCRNALVALELESRRPLEWIEHDRTRYWPNEVRKASDRVSEARIALERCETSTTGDNRRDCYDEKKALQKAKRRLNLCDEKVQAVRVWRQRMRKEIEEFAVEVAKLRGYLDSDLVRAATSLEKMLAALERYTATGGPPAEGATHASG
jgi:exonuclease VII large subunit